MADDLAYRMEVACTRVVAIDVTLNEIQKAAVIQVKARLEGLGWPVDQFAEGVFVPVDVASRGWLLANRLLGFLGVARDLHFDPLVLDDVLGGLANDRSLGVVALAAGSAADLLEVPDREDYRFGSVVFAELVEEHRADRDVDTRSEGVGSADHSQKSLLGKLFYEQAVFGE